ncbi:hypothetical protein [Pokkaliibacter plantistimulans]|nr:hypothetical protein [Pokkaliibacter plantistimulans]
MSPLQHASTHHPIPARMKFTLFYLSLLSVTLTACSNQPPTASSPPSFDDQYTELKSDFKVSDARHYGCDQIDQQVLQHVLDSGVSVTQQDVDEQFTTTGCTIHGSLRRNGQPLGFSFDYGGVLQLSDGSLLACGDGCCNDAFDYCSWNPH